MNLFLFIFALIIWNELPAQSTAGVILEKHIYQLEKAVIADPDGWSNLRESPEGRILDTFYNHELIYVYADTLKNWYAVRNSMGKEGFIHKGRIRLIKLFSPDELKSFCNRIIGGYLELHLLEKMENESCGLLSDYYFNRLTYSFDIISTTICKVWDAPLFQNFIDVLRLESGSASEA